MTSAVALEGEDQRDVDADPLGDRAVIAGSPAWWPGS